MKTNDIIQTSSTNAQNYSRELLVKTSPKNVYDFLTIKIGQWWTSPEGKANEIGDEPTFRFPEGYWKMRVIDLIRHSMVKWKCIEADHRVMGLSKNSFNEWEGTELVFKIDEYNEGAIISFTHYGLNPSLECFEVCNAGWDHYFVEKLHQKLSNID